MSEFHKFAKFRFERAKRAVLKKAKRLGVDAESLADWLSATYYETSHDEEVLWFYERRNWKIKMRSGGFFFLDNHFVKLLEEERQDARKNAPAYEIGIPRINKGVTINENDGI